jgi:flagellar hook-associated protein 2
MESFTDSISGSLDGRSVSAPEDAGFSATATSDAASGSHTIQVLQLAASDTRVSGRYADSGTTLRTFFDTNGSQTFTISVAAPTDADPDYRETISVTVNPAGADDSAILNEIATAIDDAMQAAVDAGTISDSEAAAASVVNETSDSARLSLRSGSSGYAGRLTFSDSASGLLSTMGVTNAAVFSGDGGGQVADVGTSETDSDLNARFVLDGLTIYRSSNQVYDALSGVTLRLSEVMDAQETFTVGPDTEGTKEQISDFIAKYNALVSELKGATQVDADLEIRAVFAGDSTLRSLRFGLRNDVASQVSGQPTDGPFSITDLGISIGEDGTLTLEDEEALDDALESSPGAVASLFTSADGIATRLETRLDAYLGADGIFDNRIDILDESVTRIKEQIERFEERMARREEQLRQQYAKIQESISVFQGQQQNLMGFLGQSGVF